MSVSERRTQTLHQFGACPLILGVDFLDCAYQGRIMPVSAVFDCVCMFRAKEGVNQRVESPNGTATSSSAPDDGQ